MRDVPSVMAAAWRSRQYVGATRPIARVTVQHPKMRLFGYSLTSTFTWKKIGSTLPTALTEADLINPNKKSRVHQVYSDFQFTNTDLPMELPNIKSVSWQRTIDADVAECTIEIWNTKPLQVGEVPRDDELDQPGYYTYSRGGSSFSSRWGHTKNPWFGLLVPDNIVRTFEGYGWDHTQPPELDGNLVQTGVWIIDTVTMTDRGTLSIKCRDIGRILIDQLYYPPVVKKAFYDHDWSNWDGKTTVVTKATNKLKVTPQDSSNTVWISSGTVAGHKTSHAFDGDPNTYWLSVGNIRPSRRFAYEWVQGKVGKQTVSEVRVRTKKKGYNCYISLKVNGVWQGSRTIDYHQDGVGQNHSDIKYVKSVPINTEGTVRITFPPVAKVEAIRVTLGSLQNFGFGTFHYRGGIRNVEVYSTSAKKTTKDTFKKGPAGANPGKYNDYTDIVKLLCAWGGFFWPRTGKQRDSGGVYHTIAPSKYDTAVLGHGVHGRVWGDFQQSGTSGPIPLSLSNFDKKSLMDGISYIRDILGFIFFIDELGGVQWRLPNVYNRGNWKTTLSTNPGRSGFILAIDEADVLLSLDATISSANVREAFFVGDVSGGIGAFAPGFNPNPTGLRRMAGWTDQNFETQAECEMMADMLSLRQLFTFRTDRIRIPAYPRIQIDDQIRIFERTTAEGYIHYVKGIASTLDMETGEWTYDLDTHWLGEDPESRWIFKPKQLKASTQRYLDETNSPKNALSNGPSRRFTT